MLSEAKLAEDAYLLSIMTPVAEFIDAEVEAQIKARFGTMLSLADKADLNCNDVMRILGEIKGIRVLGARVKSLVRAANTPKE